MVGLLLTQAIVLLGAGPAYAHDCGGPYRHAVSPVARTDFVWDPWCSDGKSFIGFGTVEDTNCDGRAAYAQFEVYDLNEAKGVYNRIHLSRKFSAVNGCGTWSSFPDQRPPSPGASGWRLTALIWACDSIFCSSLYRVHFYG